MLAEDAVFHSPIVHTPQRGRELASLYLSAAFRVFFNPTFRYVREIVGPSDAMLEFETEIDGTLVNGVDLIKWNESGQIVDFKVMIQAAEGNQPRPPADGGNPGVGSIGARRLKARGATRWRRHAKRLEPVEQSRHGSIPVPRHEAVGLSCRGARCQTMKP